MCKKTIQLEDQKQSYSRALDDAGQPIEAIQDKHSYHLLDAERYVLGSLAKLSGEARSAVIPAVDPMSELGWQPQQIETNEGGR